MGWDEETVARVKEMQRNGVSRHKIAKQIGMTANQVIGKLYRMGTREQHLSRRPRPIKAAKSVAKRAQATPIPVEKMETLPLPSPRVTEDVPRKQLLDLDRHECRWPIGDPRQGAFGFCALPRVADRPYCAAHARRAIKRDDECLPATASGADTSSPSG